jgi:hypothetical protein
MKNTPWKSLRASPGLPPIALLVSLLAPGASPSSAA